ESSIAITLDFNEFVKLARKASSSQLFSLKSGTKNLNGRLAIVKDVQKNPMKRGEPLHIDLMTLKDDEELSIKVPLRVVGEPVGVKISGGVLSVALHQVSVSCLPKNIPQRLELDVSSIDLGQSLHAKDIKLPDGVRLSGNPEETVASVVAVRIVEEAPAPTAVVAEGATPVEGAEGAATDAKAGEAGDAKDAAKPAKSGVKEK
ncbi:MAG: 50S ribosomal protein L25, partial [bacterium]|nr:50S ribosomal protein L25 [bacterium]